MSQTGFQLFLGHGGRPCPTPTEHNRKKEHDPLATDDPWAMEENEWEDINKDDIPPRMRPPSDSDYLTIVDVTGVHFLGIHYCTCHGSDPCHLQLFKSKLFPATMQRTRTVFTFGVLDDFVRDNLECGTSALNYYSKLRRVTSNAFPHLVPVGGSIKLRMLC